MHPTKSKLTLAGVWMLAASTSAEAQATVGEATKRVLEQNPAAPDQLVATSPNTNAVEQIVVTANKRRELQRKVARTASQLFWAQNSPGGNKRVFKTSLWTTGATVRDKLWTFTCSSPGVEGLVMSGRAAALASAIPVVSWSALSSSSKF